MDPPLAVEAGIGRGLAGREVITRGALRGAVALACAVSALVLSASPAAARTKYIGGVVGDVATGSPLQAHVAHDDVNLPYGGGPVLHSNRTHLIFWAARRLRTGLRLGLSVADRDVPDRRRGRQPPDHQRVRAERPVPRRAAGRRPTTRRTAARCSPPIRFRPTAARSRAATGPGWKRVHDRLPARGRDRARDRRRPSAHDEPGRVLPGHAQRAWAAAPTRARRAARWGAA